MDPAALARQLNAAEELRPVHLDAGGRRLFGVAHLPRHRRRAVGVLYLNSGVHNRVGPHRIYVKTARRLSRLGLVSLRLDLPGTGDSEAAELEMHFDCHDAAGVPAAIDYLTGELGVETVVLLGLCAGARVAVRAAARDPRVDAVVAWSMPVDSWAANMPGSEAGYMSPIGARGQLRTWAGKALSPAAWARYRRSDNRMGRDVLRTLSGLLPAGLRPTARRQADFRRSLERCFAERRRMLFAYGEDDEVPHREFIDLCPQVARGERPECACFVVPAGSHSFTSAAAEAAVIEGTAAWLERCYPRPAGEAA